VKEIVRVGGASGIDIVFAANKPTVNIQLGAAPQGHMVMFGGAINSICGSGSGCNIVAVSDYDEAIIHMVSVLIFNLQVIIIHLLG
jgi:hypothetical protein